MQYVEAETKEFKITRKGTDKRPYADTKTLYEVETSVPRDEDSIRDLVQHKFGAYKNKDARKGWWELFISTATQLDKEGKLWAVTIVDPYKD